MNVKAKEKEKVKEKECVIKAEVALVTMFTPGIVMLIIRVRIKEFPSISKMFIDGMLDLGLSQITAEMKVRRPGGGPTAGVPKRKRKKKKKR